MTIRFLTTGEFAERIGVKKATLNRYKLPPPDALIGTNRGWLPQTIDDWQARRPGQGSRVNPHWNLGLDE